MSFGPLFELAVILLPSSLLFGRFKGSTESALFAEWSKNVTELLKLGNECISSFKELIDKDSAILEEYSILESRFEALNPKKYESTSFSLKGKDKEEYSRLTNDLKAFIDDYDFFLTELKNKKSKFEKEVHLNKEIDSYIAKIAEFEPKQQLLARTIPRINTTSELEMVVSDLEELKTIVPMKMDIDQDLPEEMRVRIERTNGKLLEWHKKLDFIESKINSYKGKIETSAQEQAQKQNLSKIHTWLDSSETKIMKISDKLKKINELIITESTSSKELVNSQKDLEKLDIEINETKPPEIDLIGEKQTKIGIDFRLKELLRLQDLIKQTREIINETICYRISFLRSSILEKMFVKSHQLTYTQVNYSLGYKNELLLQGWLQTQQAEKYVLKNYQNKYVMLVKENITSLKESSDKIFESLQAITDFERETNEMSYNQSVKWLLANDDKWLAK